MLNFVPEVLDRAENKSALCVPSSKSALRFDTSVVELVTIGAVPLAAPRVRTPVELTDNGVEFVLPF